MWMFENVKKPRQVVFVFLVKSLAKVIVAEECASCCFQCPIFPFLLTSCDTSWRRHVPWIRPRSCPAGSCMLLQPNIFGCSHSPTVLPSFSITEYEVCVEILQNVINKCLHHPPPFSPFFILLPHFDHHLFHKLFALLSCVFSVLSFIPSFPAPLSSSLFSISTATWTACHKRRTKWLASFFVFSLCRECDVGATYTYKRWLCSDLELRTLLSVDNFCQK